MLNKGHEKGQLENNWETSNPIFLNAFVLNVA